MSNITDKNLKSNNSGLMRNEQIEEMAKIIYFARKKAVYSEYIATALYNADYRKQREGEWKHHKSTAGGIHDTYRCSICDHVTGWTTTFCPNCGAKMKGE